MVNVTIMGTVYYYIAMRIPGMLLAKLATGRSPWVCLSCEVFWTEPITLKNGPCWVCGKDGNKYVRTPRAGWRMVH